MEFMIQAGHPQTTGIRSEEDDRLEKAMKTIFPTYAEYAIMIWRDVAIPISYRYDIPLMIGDILDMINDMSKNETGSRHISWVPVFFKCSWNLVWNREMVDIMSVWENVALTPSGILNERSRMITNKEEFVAEWKMVLHNIQRGLLECGYELEDLKDYSDFVRVYKGMGRFGRLYRRQAF